ncbi:MAG: aldo/keto reductase [Stellaceae bacterium]
MAAGKSAAPTASIDEGEFRRAVAGAIDGGITCFDTAEAYGMGISEEALAGALGLRPNDVVIATKFGVGYEEMPSRRDSSRVRVLASIPQESAALRTDHVDIYLVSLARSQYAARRDDGGTRQRRAPGQGALFQQQDVVSGVVG